MQTWQFLTMNQHRQGYHAQTYYVAEQPHPGATIPRRMRSWSAKRLASLTSHVVRWSGLSTMSLLNSWGRVRGKPTLGNKLFHRLLLMKIQGEQVSSDLLERIYVATRLKVSLHPLQLEEPPCGHSHNGFNSEDAVEEEEAVVYSTLDFYCTSEIPGVLAIVRFTTSDDHERVFDVTEVVYTDTPEGYCKLEEDVPVALAHGIDVSVLSHIDPELLPEINAFLLDSEV